MLGRHRFYNCSLQLLLCHHRLCCQALCIQGDISEPDKKTGGKKCSAYVACRADLSAPPSETVDGVQLRGLHGGAQLYVARLHAIINAHIKTSLQTRKRRA